MLSRCAERRRCADGATGGPASGWRLWQPTASRGNPDLGRFSDCSAGGGCAQRCLDVDLRPGAFGVVESAHATIGCWCAVPVAGLERPQPPVGCRC